MTGAPALLPHSHVSVFPCSSVCPAEEVRPALPNRPHCQLPRPLCFRGGPSGCFPALPVPAVSPSPPCFLFCNPPTLPMNQPSSTSLSPPLWGLGKMNRDGLSQVLKPPERWRTGPVVTTRGDLGSGADPPHPKSISGAPYPTDPQPKLQPNWLTLTWASTGAFAAYGM